MEFLVFRVHIQFKILFLGRILCHTQRNFMWRNICNELSTQPEFLALLNIA
jgi:hypothetical protein